MSDNWRPEDEPPARVPGRPAPNQPQQPARPQPAPTSASRSVSVDISPRSLRLTPGEAETASISVRNLGSVVDEISLTARGEIGAWARIAPDTLNIYPNTEAQSVIRFAPPKAPRPPAGLLGFEIAVNSARQPDASFVYRGSLELAPFDNLTAAAQGTTYLTARRDAILPIKIRNLGNRATGVYVNAADLPGATVALSSTSVGLEPGAETTVWATIRPKSSFLSGPSRQHPFTIEITGDYAPPITIDGRLEQLARFSRRRLTILGVLGAGVVAVAGLLAANAAGLLTLRPPLFTPQPTAVANVTPTPTAVATASGIGEQTPTPETATSQPTDTATAGATPTASPTPDPFAGWEALGGQFSQGPAVSSWGANQLDVFAPWSDNSIRDNRWDGTAWTDWTQQEPPASTSFKPAAVDWGPNHVDLIATLLPDNNVGQQTYESGTWGSWIPLTPGVLTSGPTVTSWGVGRLDVFGRGTDGFLYHNWLDNTVSNQWNVWEFPGNLQIPIKNAPAAVSWGAGVAGSNQIDVFALHDDTKIYWLQYDSSTGSWVDRGSIGSGFSSAPAVTSWAPNEFDVFARWSKDGTLRHSSFNGVSWSNWEQLTTFQLGNAPGAVAWGNGRIDVVVVDTDGAMHHSWLENGTWNPAP